MFVTHFTLGYLLTIIFLPEILLFAWITSRTKSDKLPPQTPEPIDLRELWTKIRPRSRRTSLPTVHPTPLERNPRLPSIRSLWENRQRNTSYPALRLPQASSIQNVSPSSAITLWLIPTTSDMLRETNANDIRRVSWAPSNITTTEGLDMAIQLVGTIRWFEDGFGTDPPYNLIVSILEGRFDSAGRMYPGSRDTVYYTAWSILWIHIHAMCVSEGFALGFSLPTIRNLSIVTSEISSRSTVGWVLSFGCTIPLRGLLPHTRNGFGMPFYTCPGPSGICQARLTRSSSPMGGGIGVPYHRARRLTAFQFGVPPLASPLTN